MTVTHPAGSGASTTISKPFKAKTAKLNGDPKAPRRRTPPGEATSTQITAPMSDSALRVFYALYEHNPVWHVAYGKLICQCKDWSNKSANSVILWHKDPKDPPAYRHFCECEVKKMSEEQMLEAVA
jgi:hypothetical protein